MSEHFKTSAAWFLRSAVTEMLQGSSGFPSQRLQLLELVAGGDKCWLSDSRHKMPAVLSPDARQQLLASYDERSLVGCHVALLSVSLRTAPVFDDLDRHHLLLQVNKLELKGCVGSNTVGTPQPLDTDPIFRASLTKLSRSLLFARAAPLEAARSSVDPRLLAAQPSIPPRPSCADMSSLSRQLAKLGVHLVVPACKPVSVVSAATPIALDEDGLVEDNFNLGLEAGYDDDMGGGHAYNAAVHSVNGVGDTDVPSGRHPTGSEMECRKDDDGGIGVGVGGHDLSAPSHRHALLSLSVTSESGHSSGDPLAPLTQRPRGREEAPVSSHPHAQTHPAATSQAQSTPPLTQPMFGTSNGSSASRSTPAAHGSALAQHSATRSSASASAKEVVADNVSMVESLPHHDNVGSQMPFGSNGTMLQLASPLPNTGTHAPSLPLTHPSAQSMHSPTLTPEADTASSQALPPLGQHVFGDSEGEGEGGVVSPASLHISPRADSTRTPPDTAMTVPDTSHASTGGGGGHVLGSQGGGSRMPSQDDLTHSQSKTRTSLSSNATVAASVVAPPAQDEGSPHRGGRCGEQPTPPDDISPILRDRAIASLTGSLSGHKRPRGELSPPHASLGDHALAACHLNGDECGAAAIPHPKRIALGLLYLIDVLAQWR